MRSKHVLLAGALPTLGFARPSDPSHDLFLNHSFDRRDAAVCRDVDSGLPDSWKCPSSRVCVSLDNSTSALCCPGGDDCSTIGTVECDAKKQDPAKNPGTEVFTTKTDVDLPQCGSSCCPFGYSCSKRGDDSVCTIDKDKARFVGDFPGAQGSTSSSTSSSSSTSATSTSKDTATATSSAAKSSSTSFDDDKPNPFPPGVFIAGLVPGLFVGALAVVGWMICTGRIRKSNESTHSTPYTEKRPVISEPISRQNNQMRSDFSRKQSRSIFFSRSNPAENKRGTQDWKMLTPPDTKSTRPITPVTPTPMHESNKSESIRIYSPPDLNTHQASAVVSPLRPNQGAFAERETRSAYQPVSPIDFNEPPIYDNPSRSDRTIISELDSKPVSPTSMYRSRPPSSVYGQPTSQRCEYPTLSNERYETDSSKRDTSFTALMQQCGIPDSGDAYPVPKIPEQYKGKGKAK